MTHSVLDMPLVELANAHTPAIIQVIGVGGGGGNAVAHMYREGFMDVRYTIVNSDKKALNDSPVPDRVQLGPGLGAGGNPEKGKELCEESIEAVRSMLDKQTQMVFITAGMGGGTGTGAAPIVADCAKKAGALTVGVVTKPFSFEGKRRMNQAEGGIVNLKDKVDTLITIPNDRLLQVIDRRTSMLDAFKIADDVLRQGVQGISDLIAVPGVINADFADVKTIMSDAGSALMGIGTAKGDNGAVSAAEAAIKSPLLEASIEGARGVLFNITGGKDLSLFDVTEASNIITEAVDPEANIIFGAVIDESLQDEIRVTVIATGFRGSNPAVGGQAKANPVGWKSKRADGKKDSVRSSAPAPEAPAAPKSLRGDGHVISNNLKENTVMPAEIPPWMQGGR